MRILFRKIGYMKYFKGNIPDIDEIENGGAYVAETGDGGETYNFFSATIDNNEWCLGFVETKHKDGWKNPYSALNQLHIEKIDKTAMNDEQIDNVLVVWCAVKPHIGLRVVGWYKNATVYRLRQDIEFDDGFIQSYNVEARKEDCVLLPHKEVNRYKWCAPATKQQGYGFGQSLVWYPEEDKIYGLLQQILHYEGTNNTDIDYENDPEKIIHIII